MIKNVVFDFGQVLVRFEPMYMTRQYIKDDADAALVADILFDRVYWDRLDAGTISDEEVVRLSCSRLPERLHESVEKVYYNWIYNLPEIEGMRDIIISLKKAGKRIYLLSNISEYFAAHADEIPILKEIEKCIFSAVAGHVKPNKDMFEYLCTECKISPSETLFIDDNEKNIAGARDYGISAYLFDGNSQKLKAYLTEC